MIMTQMSPVTASPSTIPFMNGTATQFLQMNQKGNQNNPIAQQQQTNTQENVDITNIINCLKGNVRFGDGNNGSGGENINGQWAVFTTPATPNSEFIIAHEIGAMPVGWLVVAKNKAADLYTGVGKWTDNLAYFKCTVASVNFRIFFLK